MAQKKKLKTLKTGSASRSLSLASLTLKAATRAAGHAVSTLLETEAGKKAKAEAHRLLQAQALVKELGELKGSLMKVGQTLSIYGEHFFPPEVNRLLRTLQADSPPLEWPEIEKCLRRRLSKELLAELEIDPEPCGAASLAQVHRAKIRKTGELLALKIQYPGVEASIDSDLKALRRVLSLTSFLPKLPATDDLFEEVRMMLRREVDYEKEREMLDDFRARLAGDDRFVVPRSYPRYCGKKVLAMSFEEGVGIDSPEVLSLSQERRNALALAVLHAYFLELWKWRRVQTDPHFGNFKVRLGDKNTPDRLVLLDFGAVRDLPESFMHDYTDMLAGTFFEDRGRFERAAERMKILENGDPQELRDLFHKICVLITEPFLPPQPYDWKNNDLPRQVSELTWELIRKFPLRSPPREVVFIDRKMAGIFTLLKKLGARVDGRAELEPFLPAGS